MIRTAIFVEGQTELIFVREFLLKTCDYQDISIDCYTLFSDSDLKETEYRFPNDAAKRHFQILNAGNDERVLTAMLKREKYLRNAGYRQIIGLRDMYGRKYREAVRGKTIAPEINRKFIEGARAQLKHEDMHFIYSIMEIEAWLLGLKKAFRRMDERLTPEYIREQLGYDLDTIDPETYFFRPAENVSDLFAIAGKGRYDKSKADVSAIVGRIEKNDYIELLTGGKCRSFGEFCSALQILQGE